VGNFRARFLNEQNRLHQFTRLLFRLHSLGIYCSCQLIDVSSVMSSASAASSAAIDLVQLRWHAIRVAEQQVALETENVALRRQVQELRGYKENMDTKSIRAIAELSSKIRGLRDEMSGVKQHCKQEVDQCNRTSMTLKSALGKLLKMISSQQQRISLLAGKDPVGCI
jgi:regulator of replication initiation timing